MPAAKPGARRLQILQVLARMLENPKGERVTTAAPSMMTSLMISRPAPERYGNPWVEAPSQRVANTLRECPLEKSREFPTTVRKRPTTRSARAATCCLRRGSRRGIVASPDIPRVFRLSGALRIHRSPIRQGRDQFVHRSEASKFTGPHDAL